VIAAAVAGSGLPLSPPHRFRGVTTRLDERITLGYRAD
jgi:hypothetical protein